MLFTVCQYVTPPLSLVKSSSLFFPFFPSNHIYFSFPHSRALSLPPAIFTFLLSEVFLGYIDSHMKRFAVRSDIVIEGKHALESGCCYISKILHSFSLKEKQITVINRHQASNCLLTEDWLKAASKSSFHCSCRVSMSTHQIRLL